MDTLKASEDVNNGSYKHDVASQHTVRIYIHLNVRSGDASRPLIAACGGITSKAGTGADRRDAGRVPQSHSERRRKWQETAPGRGSQAPIRGKFQKVKRTD